MRKLFAKQAIVTPFEDTAALKQNQPFDERGSNEDVDWQYVQIPHPSSADRQDRDDVYYQGLRGNAEQHSKQGSQRENTYPAYEETHSDGKRRSKHDNLSRQNSMSNKPNLLKTRRSHLSDSRDSNGNYGLYHSANSSYSHQQTQNSQIHNSVPVRQNSISNGSKGKPESNYSQFPNPHDLMQNHDQNLTNRDHQASNRSLEYMRPQQNLQQVIQFSDELSTPHEQRNYANPPNNSDQYQNSIPVERSYDRYVDRTDESALQKSNKDGKGRMKNWLAVRKKKLDDRRASYLDTEHNDPDPNHNFDGQAASSGIAANIPTGTSSPPKKKSDSQAINWLGKMKPIGKASGETVITQQIGWLCAQDERLWEYGHVSPLVSAISQSEAASKEAALALREEFKLGADIPQFGAIKLMAMLFLHTDELFRSQVASKRFLESMEDLYNDKNTPTQTRGRLLVAWSMFAHLSKEDNTLKSITKVFNKIKPSGMPIDGTPLDPHNDLFYTKEEFQRAPNNQVIIQDASNFQGQGEEGRQYSNGEGRMQGQKHTSVDEVLAANQAAHAEALLAANQAARHAGELQRLHEESNVARSNAQLLTETLIEDGLDAPLLQEFAEKTELFHSFISQQIPWATAIAEQAKAKRESSIGDDAPVSGMLTEEEKVLEDLLDAHEKVIHAQSMIEQARERRREEEEEAQIIDRSMREMRMDRTELITDPNTGELYHIDNVPRGSGSRSVSPSPLTSALKVENEMQIPLQGGLLAPPMQSQISSNSASDSTMSRSSITNKTSFSGMGVLAGPRPLQKSSPMIGQTALPLMNDNNIRTSGLPALSSMSDHQLISNNSTKPFLEEGEESSDIVTPIVPSEKALGKRRAMSIREDTIDPFGDEMANKQEFSATSMQPSLSNEREDVLLTRPPPALPR